MASVSDWPTVHGVLDRPSSRTMTAWKEKTPELSLRGFFFDDTRQSGLRIARHETVVAEFGDLEPLIAVGLEVVHRIQHLFEGRIAGRCFGIQFLGRFHAGLHDRRRERMQL